MDREQIVKALECCRGKGCKECPCNCNCATCISTLMGDALALIRELTEENERLEKEVDRLSQVVLYHDSITEMEVAEAKADTVRKMQERFNQVFGGMDATNALLRRTFDQIAQEILEEVNDA